MYRIIIVSVLGILMGLFLPDTIILGNTQNIILFVLLFSVGMSIGSMKIMDLLEKSLKLIWIPLFSIVGSCLAMLVYSLISGTNVRELMLVGSAMGFYSLPAIIVSSQLGVTLGTTVLITNMFREIITIFLSPVIGRLFGKYSIIGLGGATTSDTSLAVMKEVGGNEIVPIALINGLLLTIFVPLITSLILYINF